MIDPIDSSSPKPIRREPLAKENELERRTKEIFSKIILSANPTDTHQIARFERVSQLMSTLIWIFETSSLSPDTQEVVFNELTAIAEDMHWAELEAQIRRTVSLIIKADRRKEILEMLIQLEHLFCIHPPGGQEKVSREDFQQLIGPLSQKAKQEMSPFETARFVNQLKNIRKRFSQNPEKKQALLTELQQLAKAHRLDQ